MTTAQDLPTSDHNELWRLEQLALVSQVATQVTNIQDLDELLVRVVGLIYQTFEFYVVIIFTLKGDVLVLRAQAGPADTFTVADAFIPAKRVEIPYGKSIIGWVAKHQQELVVQDVSHETRFRYAPELPKTRSEIALPLKVENRLLGVLDVQLDKPHCLDEADVLVLRALAGQVSMAIEDTRLYNAERWRYQVAESLRRISGALLTDVDLGHVLDTILLELQGNLPADVLAIWLIRNRKLRLVALQPRDSIEFVINFDPEQDPWLKNGLNAAAGPLIRQANDPPDPIGAYLGYDVNHSAIVAPLRVQDQLLGLLTLVDSQSGRYGQEAKDVTTAFANQAAIALENARLFRLAQDEIQINHALLNVAEMTQGFADLNKVLGTIVQIPPLIIDVTRCVLWLWHELSHQFEFEVAAGFKAEAFEFLKWYPLTGAKMTALEHFRQTQAPLIVLEAATDARLPAELVTRLGLRTLILLPIVAHSQMLGLMLVTFSQPATIREDSIRLITGIAHQAAVAIESKYLYAQKAEQERLAYELELAHNIQASLIPSNLPAPPGWQVAAYWQAIQAVGGDFYDFIEVGPRQLGIVIADVSGKGLPAALYMTLTRALLRATAPGQTDPCAVLTHINQLLVPDTHQGIFVSLFYAILDIETGQLRYANAGHNPPLLLKPDGEYESLRLPGMVLGVSPHFQVQLGCRQLQPGDGLILYTDGVTEVPDGQGRLFEEARLVETLQNHWAQGPQAAVDAVRQAVNSFSATEWPTDDLTLLILRRE